MGSVRADPLIGSGIGAPKNAESTLDLTAGANVRASRKFRRVSVDLGLGTYMDHHRGRNKGFDLNFSTSRAGVRLRSFMAPLMTWPPLYPESWILRCFRPALASTQSRSPLDWGESPASQMRVRLHMGVALMWAATLVSKVVDVCGPGLSKRLILFYLILIRINPSRFIRFR